ncbi:DUF296 domain-containing protein [Mesorhizobium sp. YR577]|jgi:predicted DNA-binding protein with PD1-like motif|uniref:PPC domain-containing DNA-binding protein n=1 Tax=Mesorhizobium sp. YR577 TaxID=1884373 RepID=UPI0008F2E078|nr:DUF296 domain-containing protein [Mesorhizobium sp. YR577]SFT47699.1 Predicted DNA-binding protein with PD1-like DNA-binding motif [Mesorhizobium sp. YR577]
MYKAQEFRLGRIFQIKCDPGDDYFTQINAFVREKNIRAGSVFLLGALSETKIVSGFNSMEGHDLRHHHFVDWRELVGYGNISWPEKPPAILGDVVWDEPQPFVHIHLGLSGGPGATEETLIGHLCDGTIKGGLTTQIYELLID